MSPSLSIHQWDDLDEQQRVMLLQRPAASQDQSVIDSAVDIVAAVRSGGDDALRELTQRYDNLVGTGADNTEPTRRDRSRDRKRNAVS